MKLIQSILFTIFGEYNERLRILKHIPQKQKVLNKILIIFLIKLEFVEYNKIQINFLLRFKKKKNQFNYIIIKHIHSNYKITFV